MARHSQSVPPVELGFMLCRLSDGRLTRGPLGVGTATAVQFPDACPSGTKVVGSFHTHPKEGGGSIRPSQQDMKEAQRRKMPALCIANGEKTACYAVRGVAAQQPCYNGPGVAAQQGPITRLVQLLRR